MKLFLDRKKILIATLLMTLLSPFLISYKINNLTSKYELLLNKSQENSNQLTQVELILANGYTGKTSITITKDSLYYKKLFKLIKQ